MEPYLFWLLAGFGLVIVELLTGTFYLLMLGIAAFGGAGVAFLGQPFEVQIIVASVVAAAGCYGAHAYRAKNAKQQMVSIDAGQPANFENWIDAGAGLARVRYRGASWDAKVDGTGALEPGALLYVLATEGNSLNVSRQRPA
ncbi:MAG: NfeD family protein [Betaproteobacteria bacterium]|nr:NfeD family protein [Betaproteobacteria bacterium]